MTEQEVLRQLTPFMPLLATLPVLVILITIWSLVWKGMALWRAARNNSKIWFVVLLIVNTLGILEILYLFVFGKEKKNEITGITKNREELKP